MLSNSISHNRRGYILEPYLHWQGAAVYNPLTGRTLVETQLEFQWVKSLNETPGNGSVLTQDVKQWLIDEAWVVPDLGEELSRRFRLRIATLEASTVCNQACFFCPVSVSRRDVQHMSMEAYEDAAAQLSAYKDTLEGVFMINYNEPTADPRFLQQVATLKKYGLEPAVNSNASNLTPSIVDSLMDMGGLRFLSINLSTMDREKYKTDRGRDHLPKVLENISYAARRPLAQIMDIAVLGCEDEEHEKQFATIRQYFNGTNFTVKKFRIMNRAGRILVGDEPKAEGDCLRGCDSLGSRPLEHVLISPNGDCLLCCQDYHSDYVIGSLQSSTLAEILTGDRAASLRRQAYGIDPPEDNFICAKCVFALRAKSSPLLQHVF